MDTIFNQTFKYAKKLAKDFYFNDWAKSPPKCLAFDGEVVHITREGWEHLVHLRKRTRFELLGRLFVLERAKKLLETATVFQDYCKIKNSEYWCLGAVIGEMKIRVIIRSIDGGQKHFFSVIRKGSIEKEIEGE